MECCGAEPAFIHCWDNAETHAWNLFVCDDCGTIYKRSVWQDPVTMEIDIGNHVYRDDDQKVEE